MNSSVKTFLIGIFLIIVSMLSFKGCEKLNENKPFSHYENIDSLVTVHKKYYEDVQHKNISTRYYYVVDTLIGDEFSISRKQYYEDNLGKKTTIQVSVYKKGGSVGLFLLAESVLLTITLMSLVYGIGFSFEAIKGKDATSEEAFIILVISCIILMCLII